MTYKQDKDKLTGRKLIPIQVWVEIPTHKKLSKIAQGKRMTLKAYMRLVAESEVNCPELPF